jgi:hypothetical protein
MKLPADLLERNFHFGIAAGCTGVYCGDNSIEIQLNQRPLLVAENDQCKFSARKILLVADIFVRGEKRVVPGFFGLLNQLSIPSSCQPMFRA